MQSAASTEAESPDIQKVLFECIEERKRNLRGYVVPTQRISYEERFNRLRRIDNKLSVQAQRVKIQNLIESLKDCEIDGELAQKLEQIKTKLESCQNERTQTWRPQPKLSTVESVHPDDSQWAGELLMKSQQE